jgi:hypothetical protein
MRILVIALSSVLIVVSDAAAGWNQWTTMGPGGNPLPVAIDPLTPATLYTAGPSDEGSSIYKSTDGGAHWSASSDGLTGLEVGALAVDPKTPTTVYAGGVGPEVFGVFKSTDGGQHWSPSHSGFPAAPDNESLAGPFHIVVDPQTPSTLYAGTSVGVFKSTNAGGFWSAQNTGLSGTPVTALAIDPKNPSTLFVATPAGVFKSVDAGAHWSSSDAGLGSDSPGVRALTVDPRDSATVYAGTGVGVFKSTDGGANWTPRPGVDVVPPGYVSAVAVDPQTSGTVYAATLGTGVYKSTDGGQTWASFNAGPFSRSLIGLTISPSGACLHASDALGVFSLVTRADPCASPVDPFIGVNANRFEAGQTLSASVGLLNIGSPGAADIYLGVVVPGGEDTTVFFTSANTFALGTLGDFPTYRPIATGVPLTSAFATMLTNFFSYQWTGAEPNASYTFVFYVVRAGALADGALSPDEILAYATATFSFGTEAF